MGIEMATQKKRKNYKFGDTIFPVYVQKPRAKQRAEIEAIIEDCNQFAIQDFNNAFDDRPRVYSAVPGREWAVKVESTFQGEDYHYFCSLIRCPYCDHVAIDEGADFEFCGNCAHDLREWDLE